MKNALVSFALVCCAFLGAVFINSGEAFAAESFTAAAASAAVDKALAEVPHVRSDQRAQLLKAVEQGDIVAQKAILQEIRAVSDVEAKLQKLRASTQELQRQLNKKAECSTSAGMEDAEKRVREAEGRVRTAAEGVKSSLKKYNGRLGRLQGSMTKVVEVCAALEARLDKVETRVGVAEREITQVKADVKDVAAEAGKANATAERAEAKADMALMREDAVEFSSTLSFGARRGIGASENALGFGFCALGRSGFGGCADLSAGFTGLFGGGQPAPTSAVVEVGPRWSIGSATSPLTFDMRGLLGFASQTRLSDERYAGMSGGVKTALNFNLSKISVLPVELTVDAGQVWGMYSGWVAGVKASVDLSAASKLLR